MGSTHRPQVSALGPLLLLIYINDLQNVIKFSQPIHFANDTCLLNIQSGISKINWSLNKDLKELSFWLKANTIVLNVAETKVILFKLSTKPVIVNWDLNLVQKSIIKQILSDI